MNVRVYLSLISSTESVVVVGIYDILLPLPIVCPFVISQLLNDL
jgi:hypothetical protein